MCSCGTCMDPECTVASSVMFRQRSIVTGPEPHASVKLSTDADVDLISDSDAETAIRIIHPSLVDC